MPSSLAYVFVNLLLIVPFISAQTCVSPWKKYGDSCFLAQASSSSSPGQTWHNARRVCKLYGGDLIKVESNESFNFIKDTLKNSYDHYWIGLNDIDKEDTYKWPDNKVLNQTLNNWNNGEPNNWKNEEDCVEVTWNGKWFDNSCIREFGYICERDANKPLPTTPSPPIFPNNTDKPSTCEAGWIPWGTSCYGIIRGLPKSWDDAQSDCKRRFGDLIVINSKAEEDFITNEIGNTDNEYWIGLTDQHKEGDFIWVDESDLNQTIAFWRKNEPSNDYGNEDCVEIYGKYDKGKWNDNLCSSRRSYICEKQGGVHNCPKDWVSYKDYCYQINAHPNQKLTWKNAQKQCYDFNKDWRNSIDVAQAYLTSILSKEEQEFIVKEFNKFGVKNDKFWIGLTDQNSTKSLDFYWTDGSTLNFTLWGGAAVDKNKRCAASSIEKNTWSQQSCNDKFRYVCKVAKGQDRCYDPLGIQDFRIPNNALTASSSLTSDTSASSGRLYLKANKALNIGGAWCAGNGTRQYLQIDFGELKKLTYMSVQGKSDSEDFVTSYYLRTSVDGISWDLYGDTPPAGYFKFRTYKSWRTNYEKVMNLPLPLPLVARYVRVFPLTSYLNKCMRVEFYGCEDEIDSQRCGLYWEQDKKTRNCYKFSRRKTTWDAAQQLCAAEGSNLVSVGSIGELDFLKEKLSEHKSGLKAFWIGLTDLDTEGIRRWADNTPYVLRNWYTNNPKLLDDKSNCAAMRTEDGYWTDEDCTALYPFICERPYRSPYTPKDPFNNNWKSKSDFYWPLDSMPTNGFIDGTLLARSYGKFSISNFPIKHSMNKNALQFTGKANYLVVENVDDCVSHPDSSSCPHGLSVSFLFKYKQPVQNTDMVLLDSSDSKSTKSVGFTVYINLDKVYVNIQGKTKYYKTGATFNRNVYNHMVFTWSIIDGLLIYLNGQKSSFNLHGSSNTKISTTSASRKLFIGRSSSLKDVSTMFHMTSLAIFERVISSAEAQEIYVAEIGECMSHQIAHGSFCYEFNTTVVNWNNALATCRKNNGDLMSVHSPVEQSLLTINVGGLGYGVRTWIGLNSRAKTTAFNWTDDSKVAFSHWNTNEPNNWNRRIENCVVTWPTNGMWNDGVCYLKHATACKYQRKILPKGASDTSNVEYEYVIPYFNSRTFGCPYPHAITIVSAKYGNSQKNCFRDVKSKVSTLCKDSKCSRVRATDTSMGGNPCATQRYVRKTLKVVYKCQNKISGLPDSSKCKDGYKVFDNSGICYKLFVHRKTFDDALKSCQAHSGTLVVINSRTTQMYLTTLLDELYMKTDIWIGMRYNSNTSTYYWVNNEQVNYTNWFNKQPDPRDGEYIKVGIEEGARDFLFWKPGQQNDTLPYFCQRIQDGATTPVPPTTKTPNGSCPNGWYKHTKHCYFVNNKTLSYVDAKLACRKYGKDSQLASILSIEENNKIFYDLINTTILFSWIGLSNEDLIRGFHWEDGKPVAFVNWHYNRPYTGNKHLCTGMGSGGKWWDIPCNSKLASLCKLPLGSQLPTTTKAPVTTTPQKPYLCKKDWVHFNGSCYYFSKSYKKVDYYTARSSCYNLGANLASILTDEENKFVSRTFRGLIPIFQKSLIHRGRIINPWPRAYYSDSVFIGLTDQGSEGQWKWADRSPVNYLNFMSGEPNNFKGMEDCVTINRYGYWKDEACNLKKTYVCKQTNGTDAVNHTEVAPPNTGFCENGWMLYGSKCYLFVYGKGNRKIYSQADDYCKTAQNGHLVSIHHNYENSFLLSQLHDANEPIFIGLTDTIKERSFIWTDQSPVDYTNWNSLQPSRYGDEDCVELLPYYRTKGKWNDINCNFPHGFVCQKDHSLKPPPTQSPPSTEVNPCPKGWIKYRKSCYSFNKMPASFDDAVYACRKHVDSDLISIHDPFEQAFAFSRFVQVFNHSWIGLKQDGRNPPRWSDNSEYDFKYWSTTRYTSKFADNVKCATQQFSETVDGKWQFRNCTDKFPFMCKMTRDFDKVKESGFIGNCSTGWTKIKDKCYKVFSKYSEKAAWASAREKCRTNGGDLVSVTSKELQKSLQFMIRDLYSNVWIGLNDRSKNFQFQWSDGTPLLPDSFTNWGSGEPSDTKARENCVEMNSNSGKWNDLGCYSTLAYICEHSLECRSALGMGDSFIPDDNIDATSSVGDYLPKHARILKESAGTEKAWCTNITTGEESLMVNLGEMMHITRIQTQGLYSVIRSKQCFVKGYMLHYSIDGIQWMAYIDKINDPDNISPKIMPGNTDSKSIEGNSVDIKASYLKFTPKSFRGDKVCMKLELFGCKSKCKRALGMESEGITNDQIKVSSFKKGNEKEKARPKNKKTYWCTEKAQINEYIQVDLKRPTKISRIMVSTPADAPITYILQFSENGEDFRVYKTLENSERLFSSVQSIYDLDLIQRTRYVRIVPKTFKNKICMQVELYGCVYECNSPIGMESKFIPDKFITSSSDAPDHYASMGRLNKGAYNKNAWCAKEDDKKQYLQVDFAQEAHINQIALQGFDGDNAKYVTEYEVQWSNDNDFWQHGRFRMIGNRNGYAVDTRKLSVPIVARYVRINPTGWVNGICMRVEFYGCPLNKITEPEKPHLKHLSGTIRVTSREYVEELASKNSIEFINLANKIEEEITRIYVGSETFKDGFQSVEVEGFERGSVIASFTLYAKVTSDAIDVSTPLKDAIKTGQLGEFTVDPKYSLFKEVKSGAQKSDDSPALSNGGKIALVVFFVVIVAVVLIVGLCYYKRTKSNGFRLQFAHKAFENPVHTDDQDEIGFISNQQE